jgi:hypothetical protein
MIETGDGVPYKGQETDRGKLWRSDDGGENWRLVSYDRSLGGRTHYYFRVEVSPANENEAYFLTAGYAVTLDGGETTRPAAALAQVRAVTITISGSIRQTRTGWRSPTTAASVSASIAAAPGKGFNFRMASSITLRPTIKFLTTFMETVRMDLLIVVPAVPEEAA